MAVLDCSNNEFKAGAWHGKRTLFSRHSYTRLESLDGKGLLSEGVNIGENGE
jgi:hypothetical protein